MNTILLQAQPLDPHLQAIRDQFNRPGAGNEFALVLAAIGLAVLLIKPVARLIQWRRSEPWNAGRLFRQLLSNLDITQEQRRLLERMAHDLRLQNPAVLLISPERFHQSLRAWREATHRPESADETAATGVANRLGY